MQCIYRGACPERAGDDPTDVRWIGQGAMRCEVAKLQNMMATDAATTMPMNDHDDGDDDNSKYTGATPIRRSFSFALYWLGLAWLGLNWLGLA